MIDTESLKKKILSLAFEGKLTRRLQSDTNVNLIIDRCKDDKERSVREGKCKKESFRGSVMNDSYEIPSEWAWMYITDMSLFQEGPGILAVDFRTEGIPLVRISGMNEQTVNLSGCNYLDPQMVEEKWDHFRLNKGDIVISTSASLDRIAEVDDVAEGAIPYTGLIRFKMYGGINKKYFKWFVQSPYYMEQVNNQKQGGFISHYGPTHLKKMKIPIPSVEEQERIVKVLDTIFAQIDIIDRLQQQYESDREILKEKIIDAGIRGKLTEQLPEDGNAEDLFIQIQAEKRKLIKEDKIKKEKTCPEISAEEIPYKIPKSWKWIRMGECIELLSGQDFIPENYNSNRDGIPYMTGASNIINDELVVNRWTPFPKNVSQYGDLLIVCKGSGFGKTTFNHVGEVHIARQFMAIRDISKTVDLRYIRLVLDGNIRLIKDNGQGLIPGIDRPTILNMLLPLPPMKEQKRIVDKVNELFSAI